MSKKLYVHLTTTNYTNNGTELKDAKKKNKTRKSVRK